MGPKAVGVGNYYDVSFDVFQGTVEAPDFSQMFFAVKYCLFFESGLFLMYSLTSLSVLSFERIVDYYYFHFVRWIRDFGQVFQFQTDGFLLVISGHKNGCCGEIIGFFISSSRWQLNVSSCTKSKSLGTPRKNKATKNQANKIKSIKFSKTVKKELEKKGYCSRKGGRTSPDVLA